MVIIINLVLFFCSFFVLSFCGHFSFNHSPQNASSVSDHGTLDSSATMALSSVDKLLRMMEKDKFFINADEEMGEERKVNVKRNGGILKEAQQRQKFQRITDTKVKNSEVIFCEKAKMSQNVDKMRQIVDDFAQFRYRRMQMVDDIVRALRAQSLQQTVELQHISDPSLKNAISLQFSIQTVKIFSAAKAVDAAMFGIEIAMFPFENIWRNARGEHARMVDLVVEKFKLMACAVMEMEGTAKEMIKEIIGMAQRQFMEMGGGGTQLMMSLESVNEIERIVDRMPLYEGKFRNLNFYIEFHTEMARKCLPSSVEAIANRSQFFQKLCDKFQTFSYCLVDEFKRIRKQFDKQND